MVVRYFGCQDAIGNAKGILIKWFFELMNVFGDFVRIEKMIMFDNLGVINEWVRGLWWFKGYKLVLILEVNFYFKKYFDINEN